MLFSVPSDHGLIYVLVEYGIAVILLAFFIRMIASWARLDERYAFIRFLTKLTDPFIVPLRRIVPPMGIFDISFIMAIIILITLQTLLLQALPLGW